MSKRELWEVVRADELKVGDVMRHIGSPYPKRITMIRPGMVSILYRIEGYDDICAADNNDMVERKIGTESEGRDGA